MAKIAIRVICAAWFLSMVLIGGAGRWLQHEGSVVWAFLLGRSTEASAAIPVATDAPGAERGGAVSSETSDSRRRAEQAGWGPGQVLPENAAAEHDALPPPAAVPTEAP